MNPNWTRLTLLSLRAGHVPLIWGGPGIGKTEMIHDEVHTPYWGSRSAPFLTIIPAQRDPTDASGMQFVVDGEVRSLLPDYGRTLIKEGVGTLFIDELTGGTPATLGSMQRLVQERRLGDVLIPDPIRIIMAANPADIATGGADLSPGQPTSTAQYAPQVPARFDHPVHCTSRGYKSCKRLFSATTRSSSGAGVKSAPMVASNSRSLARTLSGPIRSA